MSVKGIEGFKKKKLRRKGNKFIISPNEGIYSLINEMIIRWVIDET